MFNQIEKKNSASLFGVTLSVKSLIGITAMIFNIGILSAFAASIWSMSPMIGDESLEDELVLAVTRYVEPPKEEIVRTVSAATTKTDPESVPTRTVLQLDTGDPRKVPTEIKTVGNSVPPISPVGVTKIGKDNTDPLYEGGGRKTNSMNQSGDGKERETPETDEAPEPQPKPQPKPTPATTPIPKPIETPKPSPPQQVSRGVVNGMAVNLVKPVYSPAAKAMQASGKVTVQVLIDETGRVVSANAVNGHPLLRAAAEIAAKQSKFTPTLLSDQPVKVSGTIVYNFVPN